jgi:hypothetical protein
MGDRLQTGEPYKGLAGAAVSPVLIASWGKDQKTYAWRVALWDPSVGSGPNSAGSVWPAGNNGHASLRDAWKQTNKQIFGKSHDWLSSTVIVKVVKKFVTEVNDKSISLRPSKAKTHISHPTRAQWENIIFKMSQFHSIKCDVQLFLKQPAMPGEAPQTKKNLTKKIINKQD